MRITPVPVPDDMKWTCPDCGKVNLLLSPTCSNCNKARGAFQKVDGDDRTVQEVLKHYIRADAERRAAEAGALGTPKWTCKKCGSQNGVNEANCSNCGTPMMSGQPGRGAAGEDSTRALLRDQIKAARDAALKGPKDPPG
jgi:hypothetical protein